jgi:hypothetical protein
MNYLNSVLTVIALLLITIVAKLYYPSFINLDKSGNQPTRHDFVEAKKIKDEKIKEQRLDYLESKLPVIWVRDGFINGDVSISGSVEVEGTVDVENHYQPLEVEIVR